MKTKRPSRENALLTLADFEARRRRWLFEKTSWMERYPRPGKLHNVSRDLFGILDAVAFDLEHQTTIGIQITSRSNLSTRANKIKDAAITPTLLRVGWRILVWGFSESAKLVEKEILLKTSGGEVVSSTTGDDHPPTP